MSSTKFSYEDAVHKLNLLQSNKSTIEQIRKNIKNGEKCNNLEEMEYYLLRTGVTLPMLDTLSVIHVAGTKGKGSTCAMCESILRTHGYSTGFYSSPHLVAVRERVRIEGQILSKEKFARYFHQVYDALNATQAFEGDMPKYFSFLTVLAFNVFLKEKVDVAIVEVGIGGIVDYTNVLRKVPIVGITPLGLDHTSILGNTLSEIAAAKAGIMKPGCEAYTVLQVPEAMTVLHNVARDVKCSLNIVPEFKTYKYENGLKLSIHLEAYTMNASLAVQLAHAWIRKETRHLNTLLHKQANGTFLANETIENRVVNDKEDVLIDVLTKDTVVGLRDFQWLGRYQILKTDYAQFYLDGAHTRESMDICAKWFKECSSFQAEDVTEMHMWMWFGYDLGDFLFSGINVNTRWSFALTWIVLFFVALLFEGSKVYVARVQRDAHKKLHPYGSDERRNLLCDRDREQGNAMDPTTSRNTSSGQVSRWASFRVRTLVNGHQTLVFLVHNVVGYLLMLAVMVYNVHLLLAVVFGMMLGYFLFGTKLTRLQMQCFSTKRVVICTPECDDTAESTTPPLLNTSLDDQSDFFVCQTRTCIQPSHYFPANSQDGGEHSSASCYYGAKRCPSKVAKSKRMQSSAHCHHDSEKEDSPSVEDAQLLHSDRYGCCKKSEPPPEEKCCKSSQNTTVVIHEQDEGCHREETEVQSRENSPQITCCHNVKVTRDSQEQIVT